MPEAITIHSHYLRAVLRGLMVQGIDPETLLRELRIAPDVFYELEGRAHGEQLVRLVQRVWQVMEDEFLGLSGQRCKPGLFALMVRYVGQFDTLQAVLKESCRFYRVTRQDVRLEYEITDKEVRFFVDLADATFDVDHYLVEFLMVCMHRFHCWITGKKIRLLRTEFAYSQPAHYHASYRYLFPCDHVFERPRNVFVFGLDALRWPLIRNMEEINDYLLRAPADVMVIPGTDDTYSTQIKGLVLRQQRAGDGFPDFTHIASQLCVSPQTLRRKLQHEGTSYQQIKDVLRRDLAIDKLVHENLSVAEIGQLLGFVEPASFTRAFKQWTGISPAEYRLQAKH